MPRRHLRIICFLLALLVPVAMTGLALVGGPWQLMLMLHPGALAYWRLVERRPFRALLYSDGPWGPWALLGLGAAAPAVGTVLIHMQSRPDVEAAIAGAAPSKLLITTLMAILIGGCLNAIPEEVTLRRIILTPLQERWGAGIAVGVTALMFAAMLDQLRGSCSGLRLPGSRQAAVRPGGGMVRGTTAIPVLRPGHAPGRQPRRRLPGHARPG